MQIVAGLTLKHLTPRVWDADSPTHLPRLGAVMVSYADFHLKPAWRTRAMEVGVHAVLGVPREVPIYLDNGAFTFCRTQTEPPIEPFREFVAQSGLDWFPVPSDSIPAPAMPPRQARSCLRATMMMNRAHARGDSGCVPVVHVGSLLPSYLRAMRNDAVLRHAPRLAVGGIVPNLLRTSMARPHVEILEALRDVRRAFAGSHLHIFGVGGTSTVHLAALLGFNSADSSGWRNRAARGLIQLPGTGDRMVAELGSWRGRLLSAPETERLRACPCPACQADGIDGLARSGTSGFAHRATHNLWVLLEEAEWVRAQLEAGTYEDHFRARLDNTIYLPLIERALQMRQQEEARVARRERRQRRALAAQG